jgi:hypothetical protein
MTIHPNDNAATSSAQFEIQRSLGRIEGHLQSLGNTFTQHIQDDAANFKEIKLNLSNMQRKIYTYSGFIIAIGFAITHSKELLAFVK